MERFKLPLVGFNFAFIIYMLIMASGLVGPAPDSIVAVLIQAAIGAAVGLVVAGLIYAAVAFAGK
jgi:hypothetical protein